MSDSDDFGGLAATTPVPQQKRKAPPGGTRSEKPPSNRAGGPSNSGNKPPSTAANGANANARKKAKTGPAGSSNRSGQRQGAEDEGDTGEDSDVRQLLVNGAEDDEDMVVEQEDEVQEVQQPKQQRGGSRKPVSKDAGAAGAASSKAKGKQKAAPEPAAKRAGKKAVALPDQDTDEVMEVEGEEDQDEVMELEGAAPHSKIRKKTLATNLNGVRTNPPQKQSKTELKLAAENARLKEEVERLKGHVDDLKTQLDELLHTRHTEPEALMEVMVQNHEKQTAVQKALISDLHAQLERKEPLLRSAKKSSSFSLISRDEVDLEVQEYKTEIQTLRNELSASRKLVAERDEEVALCKQLEKELRFELQSEIERGEKLSKQNRNPPGSATRGGAILKGDDPKLSKVITLYEDLTSILVPTVKCTPGKYEGDDWTFTCVYTWKDELDQQVPEKSLNFALRMCKEYESDKSQQLIDNCHYLPLSLEMESPEFVESLGFLNQPFSFPKTQLSLFVRTLYDNLLSSQDDQDED